MNLKKKIILLLALLIAICSIFSYDAFNSAPSRFVVRYETLSSIYIPDQLSDVRILYFSDVDFGPFMDKARFEKLIDTINGLAPDAVIFGGDLVDTSVQTIDDDTKHYLSEQLNSIEAPLGKFAVLGDFDDADDERRITITELLYDADFELLVNSSLKLRNTGSQSITLVGLENSVNGWIDTDSAFANVSPTAYTIVVSHTPDTAMYVPDDLVNYMLAGHSLGGQVYWGFGAQYTPAGAEHYFRGKQTIDDSYTLDISSGCGTTETDVRMLSNAEVVLYQLKHKAITDASIQ